MSTATADVTPEATPGNEAAAQATPSLARRTLQVFTGNKLALTGVVVLVLLLAFSYLGPLLFSTEQTHTDLSQANLAPGSSGHLLGTTDLGYDMVGGSVEDFAKFLREDIERYRKLTAAAGIEPQ